MQFCDKNEGWKSSILARQDRLSNLNASYIKKYSTNLDQVLYVLCHRYIRGTITHSIYFHPLAFFFLVTLIDFVFVVVVVTTLEEDHENKQVWIKKCNNNTSARPPRVWWNEQTTKKETRRRVCVALQRRRSMSAYKKWDLLSVRLIKLSAPKYDPLYVSSGTCARAMRFFTHAQVDNALSYYRALCCWVDLNRVLHTE